MTLHLTFPKESTGMQHAFKFDEVRVIFDRYDVKSLKGNIRTGLIGGIVPVNYKVTDTTRICRLETKHFLALVKPKKKLKNFLALKPTLE